MHSTNLDQSSINSTYFNVNCLLANQEKSRGNILWVAEEECEGRRENLAQLHNLFCKPNISTPLG
jgi:hypothetical protein